MEIQYAVNMLLCLDPEEDNFFANWEFDHPPPDGVAVDFPKIEDKERERIESRQVSGAPGSEEEN